MVLVWSRLALALAAALLLAAPPAQAKNRSGLFPPGPLNVWCCYDYYEDANGWLRFFSKPANWSTAEMVCKRNGGELASVVKIGTMMLHTVPHVDTGGVHVGVIPSMSDEVHSVIPFSYKMNMPLFGEIEPIDAKEMYPFICHRKNETVKYTKCGTVGNGYRLDNRTGHCYKFYRKATTFIVANQNCRVHGASLVVINNETEAQVVREIFARNPADTISGDVQKNVAFIGVFKNELEQWVTIENYTKTLKEVGYDRFAPGEPNNARGDEICGSVRRDGLLQDEPCDRLMPFICERLTDLPLCPFKEPDERCDDYYY